MLVRAEIEREQRLAFRETLWCGIKADIGAPFRPIQASITEGDAALAVDGGGDCAALGPLHSAYFKQVAEVGAEIDAEPAMLGTGAKIVHGDAFMVGTIPEEFGAAHMQGFTRQHDLAILVDVRIGEVHVEDHIVILHCRGQQQRPLPVYQEFQQREMPHVIVENAAGAEAGMRYIAQRVEQAEAVAMLERTRPALRYGLRGLDVKAADIVSRLFRWGRREGFCLHERVPNRKMIRRNQAA